MSTTFVYQSKTPNSRTCSSTYPSHAALSKTPSTRVGRFWSIVSWEFLVVPPLFVHIVSYLTCLSTPSSQSHCPHSVMRTRKLSVTSAIAHLRDSKSTYPPI